MHLTSTILDKMITAFSWMLIHSLWQGLFLSIIAGAVLMLNKRSSAVRRYNLSLILFAAFGGMCAFTFIWEWNNAASQTIVPPFAGAIGANVSALFSGNVHSVKQLTKAFTDYFSANAPLIVMIWFVFFLFKSVRMIACLVYNQRVRNLQIYEPGQFWADTVAALSEKLQIKKAVRLLQSGYVKMPVVIGHLKPIILIPVGLMAGLPAEQIEAILLHELAHIRRNDYFINFLQNIAETVFFFNPGLLWISSLLREERENCCDDIALAQTQNKRGFVQALIIFKEHELYGSNYATAFPGKKNYLLRRVSRIMDSKYEALGLGEKMFFMCGTLILCVVITTAALAHIKEYAGAGVANANPVIAYKKAAIAPAAPKAVNKTVTIEFTRIRISSPKRKMATGMTGIIQKEAHIAAMIEGTPPVPAVIAMVKQTSVTIDRRKIEIDRKEEVTNQVEAQKQQEEARRDQAEAQKDQEQAVRDQEQARLDQIQAKKDQDQGVRDQEQVRKDQEQALKEQKGAIEQVKKDQAQAQKDQEQAKRGETVKNKTNVNIQE